MMKFAHFVSLFLVCVLMVHAVDGRKHHRHMKRGKERMRPEEGAREIVPKLVRNTNKATDAVLDVVKNDNKATAENKVLPLIKQDTAITASDVQVEAEELPVQTKHRRGRKGRERFAFRKKDEGFHKHKRGLHKRHRGHRKRGHPKINEENLNIKNLGKLIKRAKHMGRKQNREQLKKDNTH